jgi:cytochrome c oxidase cbb3-type subunit III
MKLSRIFLAVLFAAAALTQSKNPLAGRPEAIEAGKRRFREACAVCHGGDGEGGRGPNLAESESLKRMADDQLFNTIRRGIPGTNMPAFTMPDTELWEIVSFVRALSTPAFLTPVPGDAEQGRKLFFGTARCDACHMIRGQGGFLGPDLTNIAALRTAAQLRQSMLQPNTRRLTEFTGVTVVLEDGRRIEGVAKNNTNYSIQVLDAGGKLHLIDKTAAREISFRKDSLMSGKYASTDLENLLAFLSKQVVRPDARPGKERHFGEDR